MGNIIGDNRKENPLLKRRYSHALLNEYMASRGIKIVNLENTFVLEDIERFIKERENSINRYSRFLDGLTIEHHDSDTVESIDAREFIISRTCDYDTTIVSADRKVLNMVNPSRVIIGNVKIYHGIPTIAHKVKDGYHYHTLDHTRFKTIMKTNPSIDNIKYFSELKEVSGFNLIVGVTGNIYDRDMNEKLEAMNNLSNDLDSNYVRFKYYDENDYIYLIASQNLKRIK